MIAKGGSPTGLEFFFLVGLFLCCFWDFCLGFFVSFFVAIAVASIFLISWQNFLAPAGYFHSVVYDLDILLNDDSLIDKTLAK